ncbi:MAG: hypothetical protein FD180_714 [Planctomycetota bacterium]|nr:MAG: hypothetical protein FD180_714 [Planctomycetota bacterium]
MGSKRNDQMREAQAFQKSVASSVAKVKAMPPWMHLSAWVIEETKGPEASKRSPHSPPKTPATPATKGRK